jgi:hypothetical protein
VRVYQSDSPSPPAVAGEPVEHLQELVDQVVVEPQDDLVVLVGAGQRLVKALSPVISRPTISDWTVSVPS